MKTSTTPHARQELGKKNLKSSIKMIHHNTKKLQGGKNRKAETQIYIFVSHESSVGFEQRLSYPTW